MKSENSKLEEGFSKILENSKSGLPNFWKFENSKIFKWMMPLSFLMKGFSLKIFVTKNLEKIELMTRPGVQRDEVR